MKKTDTTKQEPRRGTVSQPTEPRTGMGRQTMMPSFSDSVTSFIVEVAKVVIISLAIIIPIRYFLIQPFYVKGASMEPNFYDNEYLVVDEISYRIGTPHRGDVVVLRNPKHESDFFIKRVIGLPGERIQIVDGHVVIYSASDPEGVVLDESAYLDPSVSTSGSQEMTLQSNQYYVLGDNRDSSLDSRYFGPVVRKEIVGRTWLRAWPVGRMTVFKSPSYATQPYDSTFELTNASAQPSL